MEGEQEWVMQGFLSTCLISSIASERQKYFAVLSLHISNMYANKKGIAKKLILTLRVS